jgi:hypothetical protein
MPKRLGPALSVLALILLNACNSKNPDALNPSDVDENYAANEANYAENVDSGAANVTARAGADSQASEAGNSAQANIDAAVNSLRDLEAKDNEVQQAEDEFNRENDDSDQN